MSRRIETKVHADDVKKRWFQRMRQPWLVTHLSSMLRLGPAIAQCPRFGKGPKPIISRRTIFPPQRLTADRLGYEMARYYTRERHKLDLLLNRSVDLYGAPEKTVECEARERWLFSIKLGEINFQTRSGALGNGETIELGNKSQFIPSLNSTHKPDSQSHALATFGKRIIKVHKTHMQCEI